MEHDITISINDKIHKLVHSSKVCFCTNCSLRDFCDKLPGAPCPARGLGGGHFVELKVEK